MAPEHLRGGIQRVLDVECARPARCRHDRLIDSEQAIDVVVRELLGSTVEPVRRVGHHVVDAPELVKRVVGDLTWPRRVRDVNVTDPQAVAMYALQIVRPGAPTYRRGETR
ncbi:hypothetical protein ACFWTE_19525 [Nocardiopsis sp. NPDC058631]|uniref:hypothetical protein n=1 Tax=Nocardiopsis sp. NPDC058631 TaxID=3346566 RepID=UPI0036517A0B